jgi:hypothetical protein
MSPVCFALSRCRGDFGRQSGVKPPRSTAHQQQLTANPIQVSLAKTFSGFLDEYQCVSH